MASVGSILSGAFRPFREQPVTVAVWALIYIGFSVATGALMVQGISTNFSALQTGAISPGMAIGGGLLFGIVSLFVAAIMNCAVYRAVLRRDDGGFASLRLGSDEFRMVGLYIIIGIAVGFLAIVFMLGIFMIVGGAAFASGGSAGGGFLFAAVLMIAFVLAFIYVGVRLSLVFPMTFLRLRIAIDDGWALSRGNFWKLFLVYLVIWVILIVLQMLVPGIPGEANFIESIRAIGNPAAMRAMQAGQQASLESISLTAMLPALLIGGVVQVISNVLTNAAAATAVRELLLEDGEVLDDEIEETARVFD